MGRSVQAGGSHAGALLLWGSLVLTQPLPACPQDGSRAEREWMAQFSRLLYVIERHNTVTRPYLLQTARLGRPKASGGGGGGAGDEGGAAGAVGSRGSEEDGDTSDEEMYPPKAGSAMLRVGCELGQLGGLSC